MPPKKIETPKPSVDQEVKDPEVKDPQVFTVNKVRCQSSIYMVNPFTGDRFLPNEPIDATLDNWLECQIAAKLVSVC